MFTEHRRLFTYICAAAAAAILFGTQFFGGLRVSAASESFVGTDFSYTLNVTAETAEITKYTGAGGKVSVPSTVTVPITTQEEKPDGTFEDVTRDIEFDIIRVQSGAFRENGTVTYVSFGNPNVEIEAGAFYGCTGITEIKLPSKLTEIGDETFAGCTALKEISTPSTVKTIGENAFQDCINLTKATINSGNIGTSAFEGCDKLATVILKSKVSEVGERAFYGCKSLVNLTTSAKVIGDYAFAECSALPKFKPARGFKSVGNYAFYNCDSLENIVIPEKSETIGDFAFAECDNLEAISIRKGVQSIGNSAFQNCIRLETVDLSPKTTTTLTSIGEYAFQGCVSIDGELVLPRCLDVIGSHAFQGLSIEKIIIPATVTEVGYRAFADCRFLTDMEFLCERPFLEQDILLNVPQDEIMVTIPCGTLDHYADALELDESRFHEHEWPDNWTVALAPTANNDGVKFKRCKRCGLQIDEVIPRTSNIGYHFASDMTATVIDCSKDSDVTTVVVPETTYFDGKKYTVVAIGEGAFEDCTNLKNVTLPKTIKNINTRAFAGCTNLKTMVIPDSVTNIDEEAFMNCANLNTVALSKSLKTINKRTFKGCTALKDIEIPPQVVDILEDAFNGTSLTDVTIPETCERILDNAFANNPKLTDVVFKGRTAPDVRANAFSNINPTATYYVPCEKAPEYKYELGPNFIASQKMISPEHKWSEWVLKPSATTSSDGEKTRECYNCGEVQTEKVPTIIILKYSYDEKARTATVISCTDDSSVTKVAVPSKTIYDGVTYSVTGIGASAFEGRTNLTALTLPAGITYIGQNAFRGCSNLKNIVVPNSVTSIGEGAFAECTTLSKATLPDRLTVIPDSAFAGCVALKSFKMPGNVDKIGEKAFYDSGLTSVVIPSPSTEIDSYAFGSSSNLKSVTIAGRKITSDDSSAFSNISDTATFKIPCGTKKTYSKLLSGKTVQENAHKWGKWEEAEDGSKTRKCTVCGEYENDTKNVTSAEYDFIIYKAADWDKVYNTAKNIKGGTLNVDLRAKLSVPTKVLSAMKGKETYMNLELNNGLMFQLYGKSIKEVTTPLNLNAKPVSGVIPKRLVDKTANGRINYQIQIPSRADFGLTATLIPKFKLQHYGQFANLFYYNKRDNRMEFVRYSPIEDNGYAYLDINHASEYLLVISDEPMGVNIELGAGVEEPALA